MKQTGRAKCPHCGCAINLPRLHKLLLRRFIMELYDAGWSEFDAAANLGVCTRTVRNWLKIYRALGFDIPNKSAPPIETKAWVESVLGELEDE